MIRGSVLLAIAAAALMFLVGCLWVLDLETRVGRLEGELTALRAEHDSHVRLVKQLHCIGVRIPGERRKTDEPQRQSRTPEGR